MKDEYTQFEQCEQLLCELGAHALDDADGTVPVFRYSDELIDFMNDHEAYDPTEARDMLHAIHADLFDKLASPAPLHAR